MTKPRLLQAIDGAGSTRGVEPDRITIGEKGAARNMHAMGLDCGL